MKKNMINKIVKQNIGILCVLLMIFSPNNNMAFAGTWEQNEKGWWYCNDDGTFPRNIWKQVENDWYLFDKDGYMQTGWRQVDGRYYYLKSDGAMAVNTWVGNYYVGSDGAMLVNAITPDGYYVGDDGMWVPTIPEYSEEELLNIIKKKAPYTVRNHIVADFNGDGKDEVVALLVDTRGEERGCTAYRWYTDGVHTYCFSEGNYWWLKADEFYLIPTDDGIHLAESVEHVGAGSMCHCAIYEFNSDGAVALFEASHGRFFNPQYNRIVIDYPVLDPENFGDTEFHEGAAFNLDYVGGKYEIGVLLAGQM